MSGNKERTEFQQKVCYNHIVGAFVLQTNIVEALCIFLPDIRRKNWYYEETHYCAFA